MVKKSTRVNQDNLHVNIPIEKKMVSLERNFHDLSILFLSIFQLKLSFSKYFKISQHVVKWENRP